MRINRFVAAASGMSRRAADQVIESGRVSVNGTLAQPGTQATERDTVTLDGKILSLPQQHVTVLLYKPVGYVCSRDGQGSKTVYDLLPPELHGLKPIGRLDKDSSGLLLLTDDGLLAHQLTHPSFQKLKIYEIELDKPLQPLHRQMIGEMGVRLDDGPSKLGLERMHESSDTAWKITMREGRNRQIRRTFASLGYAVIKLHRTQFGTYQLNDLAPGAFSRLEP